LFNTSIGWAMLITGFLSEVAGIIMIRRIITIKI
jgi:Flp pilus assembly protein TadB